MNKFRVSTTSLDVAKRAGVSRSAVSRAFTAGASIAPKTKAKVLRAAAELGYQVNALARSVIQKQSNLIGVVTSGFSDMFRLQLLGAVTHHLGTRDFVPILMDAADPDQMTHALRILLSYQISGVVMTSGAPPAELAEEYLRRHIPVVMMNRAPDVPGVDVINSSNRDGGILAARTLLDQGARRLTFINTQKSTFSGVERGRAFLAYLQGMAAQTGCSAELHTVEEAGYQAGYIAAQTLLSRPQVPDGVFCATDLIAVGFIDGLRRQTSLRVPQDVKVVGFDDISLATMESYALTTIRQNTDSLAQAAVASLVERIGNPALPQRVLEVPVSLVRRMTA